MAHDRGRAGQGTPEPGVPHPRRAGREVCGEATTPRRRPGQRDEHGRDDEHRGGQERDRGRIDERVERGRWSRRSRRAATVHPTTGSARRARASPSDRGRHHERADRERERAAVSIHETRDRGQAVVAITAMTMPRRGLRVSDHDTVAVVAANTAAPDRGVGTTDRRRARGRDRPRAPAGSRTVDRP